MAFTCNTCSIIFEMSQQQRTHMREPWHIENIKRRASGSQPLTLSMFQSQNSSLEPDTPAMEGLHLSDSDADSGTAEEASMKPKAKAKPPPTTCLFCNADQSTLEANVEHMLSTHGLFIPEPESLTDLESFLGYLGTIVFECFECLYCGTSKLTLEGVQMHMLAKGHSKLNLHDDSELLDFWEPSSDEEGEEGDGVEEMRRKMEGIRVSETEMRLASGAIINSRSDTAQLRAKPGLTQSRLKGEQARKKRDELKAITDGTEGVANAEEKAEGGAKGVTDRRVAVRGEQGLIGITAQQRHALMVTEKKMKKRESVARAAQQWAKEKVANKQKFFRPDVPGRMNG